MHRSPLVLAALADAAVPGLRPQTVHEAPAHDGEQFQVVFLTGADGREWVVRSARTSAVGAQMEQSEGLLRLLAKRVPFEVPRLVGTTITDERTVVGVFPRLEGQACRWRELEGGSALARGIGRSLAALHDCDPRIVDDAGLPTYDADAYRARRLATLDRAATTGLVPAGLLGRWERALEEVSLWRFPTCVTHGPLEGRHVLAQDDRVVAVTGWEQAALSDPAADFAPLSVLAGQDAFDTVLEAYAGARREAPDTHLERRIRLAAELQRVNALLDAVSRDDDDLIERRTAALRRLATATDGDEALMPPEVGRRRTPPGRTPTAPRSTRPTSTWSRCARPTRTTTPSRSRRRSPRSGRPDRRSWTTRIPPRTTSPARGRGPPRAGCTPGRTASSPPATDDRPGAEPPGTDRPGHRRACTDTPGGTALG